MKKTTLNKRVETTFNATRDALQTVYDSLNNGQKKQIIKVAAVKELFDRYGVVIDV